MKVSEWKLENSVEVGDENYEFLSTIELYSKAELVKGTKFLDAVLDDPNSSFNGASIHLMDSEMGLFDITEDPEWDVEVEVAEQKFKVRPKS